MSFDQEYFRIYRENGRKTAEIKAKAATFAQTHWNMADVDDYVNTLIKKAGGEAAFALVPGYHWATCINVNDGFVHGIPKGTFKQGDLVTIDLGMYYQGTTSDTAISFVIGKATPEQQHFLDVGQRTLKKTIERVRAGNRIRDLSETIQKNIEAAGYNVTRNLTGHGVGKTMHEEPPIPCFVSSDPDLRTKIEVGMVLAVEILYMKGDWPLVEGDDGWLLSTRDGSDSACIEEDVFVTPDGPVVLTEIK